IVPVAGEKPHASSVAADQHSEPIVFDFVQPTSPSGRRRPLRRTHRIVWKDDQTYFLEWQVLYAFFPSQKPRTVLSHDSDGMSSPPLLPAASTNSINWLSGFYDGLFPVRGHQRSATADKKAYFQLSRGHPPYAGTRSSRSACAQLISWWSRSRNMPRPRSAS